MQLAEIPLGPSAVCDIVKRPALADVSILHLSQVKYPLLAPMPATDAFLAATFIAPFITRFLPTAGDTLAFVLALVICDYPMLLAASRSVRVL